MSISIEELRKSLLAEAQAAFAAAVRHFAPAASLVALCVVTNNKRVESLRGRLATVEAEIEGLRVRRNAAARRLVSVGGRPRPRPAESSVSFPVFQKVGAP